MPRENGASSAPSHAGSQANRVGGARTSATPTSSLQARWITWIQITTETSVIQTACSSSRPAPDYPCRAGYSPMKNSTTLTASDEIDHKGH